MTDEMELARTVHDGKLDLLCPEMQLLRCPGYHDSLLDGSGVIRSNIQGRLFFQMAAPINGIPELARRAKRPHGELYEAQDHVMLRAVDHRGREWRSNWFLPKLIHPNTGSPSWLVRNDLETLGSDFSRPLAESSEGRIYIPRQRHLPFDRSTYTTVTVEEKELQSGWSLDHHVRKIAGAETEFRAVEDEWLVVTVKQDTPVMPYWPGRICQALSFATAETARPVVASRELKDWGYLGVFSGPFVQFQSHLTQPLMETHSETAEDFWQIVQQLVEWSNENDEKNAGLFEELAGIRSGAVSSIQTACLTLAVGIESLADLLLDAEPVNQGDTTLAQIKDLLQHVRRWEGDKTVRDRATSMLGAMSRIRAVDRLHAFAKRTGVPEKLVTAWKKLRDMKAHGRTTEDDQLLHDLYYSGTEFLNRLVCSAVGYTGRITETSRRGWGLDEWGFPQPTDPSRP